MTMSAIRLSPSRTQNGSRVLHRFAARSFIKGHPFRCWRTVDEFPPPFYPMGGIFSMRKMSVVVGKCLAGASGVEFRRNFVAEGALHLFDVGKSRQIFHDGVMLVRIDVDDRIFHPFGHVMDVPVFFEPFGLPVVLEPYDQSHALGKHGNTCHIPEWCSVNIPAAKARIRRAVSRSRRRLLRRSRRSR